MKTADEFWEYYPEPRDSTYFMDSRGGIDINKIFDFANEFAEQYCKERDKQFVIQEAGKYICPKVHTCIHDENSCRCPPDVICPI